MLIECPECGSQVSDKAKCCPHCGYSLEDARNERAAEEAAIVAQENQATYDATFRPNEIYLASPMPFKALFRAFTTKGRASRAEFWSYFVFYCSATTLLLSLFGRGHPNPMAETFMGVFIIYGFIALWTVYVRRDHDVEDEDARGCLTILAFVCLLIPIIGWIVFLGCLFTGLPLFQPSYPGSNKHGPPPNSWYNETEPSLKTTRVRQYKFCPKQGEEVKHESGFINVRCPYCGENCEVPNTVVDGQHIICPYCEQKFSYSAN